MNAAKNLKKYSTWQNNSQRVINFISNTLGLAMLSLVEKIVAVHNALEKAKLPHAFGGALALAWCTEQARGTIDIDVNILVDVSQSELILGSLPKAVTWTPQNLERLIEEGQERIWWDKTPLDIFLNSTPYHENLWQRIHWEEFADNQVPFLSCLDLAVFKAFFNRTKDWADLEAMHQAGTLDRGAVADILAEFLGDEDERLTKLSGIAR
jgi:hypothetical protein